MTEITEGNNGNTITSIRVTKDLLKKLKQLQWALECPTMQDFLQKVADDNYELYEKMKVK